MDIDDLLGFEYTDTGGDNSSSFKLSEVPKHKREKFKRLKAMNEGTHNGKWRDESVMHAQDRERDFETVASYLELSPFQKEESKRVFENLDHEKLGFSSHLVALSVCAHIVWEDGRNWSEDDRFMGFLEDQDYPAAKIVACVNSVGDEIDR